MSIHINAQPFEIAPIVLMPGDPLRAKYIADNFLQNVKQVSGTRNIYFFTGTYKDKPVTVGASGMGCPSIGIYSYELFTEYNVGCIIRIGTCGAYTTGLKLFDLVNVERAFSESTYAQCAFGFPGDHLYHEGKAYAAINATAAALKMELKKGAVHSSDVFYRSTTGTPEFAHKNDCMAVEMEAFALFANAKQLKKSAATLLTVSDIIPTHEQISADEREKALLPMMRLALETVAGM
ncbi:MAG: purine-nucleoside phosphorylase [Chitinophagaceae bacterium]|nr:purine-nucleoside phosphorylase [Chitinophagaceae bacterium]